MKVVLFCGGLGTRLRESADGVPKPMVHIGYRPILWHVMKYYAHHGHKDFVLCLGYKADALKSYFRHYDECLSNDFIISNGGRELQLMNRDIEDWRITFVDTGVRSNIGQRLRAVAGYLEEEDIFLANYADGLTDLPLPAFIRHFETSGKIAMFVSVKPTSSFHVVTTRGEVVTDIRHLTRADIRINGGYFIFRRDIFKYLREGEELVEEPFQRLIRDGELLAYRYDGFWACMDTFKDKERLEDMCARGEAPWEVWKASGPTTAAGRPGGRVGGPAAGGPAGARIARAE
jgi:glucose-1-phosphate cytidylyltransferase